jgi:hypothetical protein
LLFVCFLVRFWGWRWRSFPINVVVVIVEEFFPIFVARAFDRNDPVVRVSDE